MLSDSVPGCFPNADAATNHFAACARQRHAPQVFVGRFEQNAGRSFFIAQGSMGADVLRLELACWYEPRTLKADLAAAVPFFNRDKARLSIGASYAIVQVKLSDSEFGVIVVDEALAKEVLKTLNDASSASHSNGNTFAQARTPAPL